MAEIDIEKLAREADPSYAGNQQSAFDSSCLAAFAAGLLKEVAKDLFSDDLDKRLGRNYYDIGPADCAVHIRTIAEGLKP